MDIDAIVRTYLQRNDKIEYIEPFNRIQDDILPYLVYPKKGIYSIPELNELLGKLKPNGINQDLKYDFSETEIQLKRYIRFGKSYFRGTMTSTIYLFPDKILAEDAKYRRGHTRSAYLDSPERDSTFVMEWDKFDNHRAVQVMKRNL